ncbi:superoxide dismutase [Coniella lustricola]|uniref:superoxide dismutase n=1 Tax=Coniella lustricola TaxID=2025994 RepID=A0A2T2ZWQ9_9PEZI|nr:superoxide dismutase [Coniella lustricola]
MHCPGFKCGALLAMTFGLVASQKSENGITTGKKGNATVVKDNPDGVGFLAVLPTRKQFTPTPAGPIQGVVYAQTNSGGTGVKYDISFKNLPEEGGPFVYHIHQKPVPSDGNCTDTEAHLDPFERGETPPCDPDLPQTCQVGDLAGKHGAIVTSKDNTDFSESYTDDFTATGDGKSFIGNLSVVIHYANLTRIACANFEEFDASDSMNMMSSLDDLLDMDDSYDYGDDGDDDGGDDGGDSADGNGMDGGKYNDTY